MSADTQAEPARQPPPATAEARLEANRARMRARLAPRQEGLAGAANRALPQAREWVRLHPYASVAGAVVAGALIARGTPWRRLRGSSHLAGTLARQALALSGVAGVAGAGLLTRIANIALTRHGERGSH